MPAGPVTKLQRSFAYRVSRLFPSEFLRWIDVVSGILDGLVPGGGSQANTRYVSLAGDDASGDGSFEKPYLTIAAAMASITLASITNPWLVDVGPGVFATSFTVKNGVTVVGKGSGGGYYNGAPLSGVTIVAPNTVQVLDASFAGAADKTGGIASCAFSQDFQADFASIGSTGQANFVLSDVSSENDVIFQGAGTATALSEARIKGLYINSGSDLKLLNMAGSAVSGYLNDFGGSILYTQAGPFQGFHQLAGSFCRFVSLTWTSAAIGNFLLVSCTDTCGADEPVVVGVGAILVMPTTLHRVMSNAANRLAFGNDAAATIVGVNCALNIIECTPTANRVLTLVRPNSNSLATEILVRNLATTGGLNIDLAFSGGTLAPGSPTYVPAGGQARILFEFNSDLWMVSPQTQQSLVVLAGGVSAFIPADVSVRTSFDATLATFNGVCGTPYVKSADTVVGTRAGGGGFKVHSITPATGADVATDNGTYWWTAQGL